MTSNVDSYGASALIQIRSEFTIEKIGKKIASGLMIPEFRFETNEDPPHDLVGLCETLGYEIWLNKTRNSQHEFSLKIETTNIFNELFHDRMCDISLWFARHVSLVCELETSVLDEKSKNVFHFSSGELQA